MQSATLGLRDRAACGDFAATGTAGSACTAAPPQPWRPADPYEVVDPVGKKAPLNQPRPGLRNRHRRHEELDRRYLEMGGYANWFVCQEGGAYHEVNGWSNNLWGYTQADNGKWGLGLQGGVLRRRPRRLIQQPRSLPTRLMTIQEGTTLRSTTALGARQSIPAVQASKWTACGPPTAGSSAGWKEPSTQGTTTPGTGPRGTSTATGATCQRAASTPPRISTRTPIAVGRRSGAGPSRRTRCERGDPAGLESCSFPSQGHGT